MREKGIVAFLINRFQMAARELPRGAGGGVYVV